MALGRLLRALAVGMVTYAAAAHAQPADLAATLAGAAARSAAAIAGTGNGECPGDCDGNDTVSVDEMVRGILIASGALAAGNCPAFDLDSNGSVSVSELVSAVRRLLDGCGGGGAMSVCGGPITSAPKLCDLAVEPARVEVGRSVTISFGMSDLEGDLVSLCLGIRRVGGTSMEECTSLEPVGETVNLIAELPAITVNLAPGDYEIAMQVIDATGARSEIVTARFTVFRIRR